MRKLFLGFLALILLISGTFPGNVGNAHADDLLSGWHQEYGTDVFGDTDYSKKYIQTSVFCSGMGKFGGVAVIGINDAKAVIDLHQIDNDFSSIYPITDKYTSYEVNIKDSSGNKYKYECEQTDGVIVIGEKSVLLAMTNLNKSNRLISQLETFFDILAAGGKIQFVISPTGYSSIKYEFIIEDNSFLSVYGQ